MYFSYTLGHSYIQGAVKTYSCLGTPCLSLNLDLCVSSDCWQRMSPCKQLLVHLGHLDAQCQVVLSRLWGGIALSRPGPLPQPRASHHFSSCLPGFLPLLSLLHQQHPDVPFLLPLHSMMSYFGGDQGFCSDHIIKFHWPEQVLRPRQV